MVQIRNRMDDGAKEEIRLRVAEEGLDFTKAKELAKRKAREASGEAMLLSWCNAQTGEYYPTFECGRRGRPAWRLYAEARGADLTVDVNDGRYVFMFLKLSR